VVADDAEGLTGGQEARGRGSTLSARASGERASCTFSLKPSGDLVQNCIERPPPPALYGALPQNECPPSHLPQRGKNEGVPVSILLNFCSPKLLASRGDSEHRTIVAMPEASIYKNRALVLWEG
jgi:hypothetical protein